MVIYPEDMEKIMFIGITGNVDYYENRMNSR